MTAQTMTTEWRSVAPQPLAANVSTTRRWSVRILSTLLVLGAILLTGYLGGAVATNVRAGTPMFNLVFPFLFAVLVWGPLLLRDNRLAHILKGESR